MRQEGAYKDTIDMFTEETEGNINHHEGEGWWQKVGDRNYVESVGEKSNDNVVEKDKSE